MTLMIKSWPAPGTCGAPATGSPCDPCKPPAPPPPSGNGGGLPSFTDAAVNINQIQIVTDIHGNQTNYSIGSMIIYSAIDNIAPQGSFGVPSNWVPPPQGSVVSWVVLYRSFITIRHPYYPFGSYNDALSDITTGPLSGADPSNQAAAVTAGNAAIAQANQVLGNP